MLKVQKGPVLEAGDTSQSRYEDSQRCGEAAEEDSLSAAFCEVGLGAVEVADLHEPADGSIQHPLAVPLADGVPHAVAHSGPCDTGGHDGDEGHPALVGKDATEDECQLAQERRTRRTRSTPARGARTRPSAQPRPEASRCARRQSRSSDDPVLVADQSVVWKHPLHFHTARLPATERRLERLPSGPSWNQTRKGGLRG